MNNERIIIFINIGKWLCKVYFHSELSFCTLICTQDLLSLITCLLFLQSPLKLLQMLDGEFLEISRFEDSKRLSSPKVAADLLPAPPDARQAVAHLAGLKNWQLRWAGAHLGHVGNLAQERVAAALQVWPPSYACPAPSGYRAKLLLLQELQDQTPVQESKWQTNHALSHSPVRFTCLCAWRAGWVHMHMCTRWVFKPNNYKKVFCVFMTLMNNMHPCDHRH